MSRFRSTAPNGVAVQQLEGLVRTAIFKPATVLVGQLLQEAADRIDAAYQPKAGQQRKGRVPLRVQCIFGSFQLERDSLLSRRQRTGPLSGRCRTGIGARQYSGFDATGLLGRSG